MKKLLFVLVVALFSCTQNQSVKTYGGTDTMFLPQGGKLINITWKEANMWYLSRPMAPQDSAQTYIFHEKSDYGVWGRNIYY